MTRANNAQALGYYVALGPAVGGALLATSPDAVWWVGALVLAVTGADLLGLGDRIPDPLLQKQCAPVEPARVAHSRLAAGRWRPIAGDQSPP